MVLDAEQVRVRQQAKQQNLVGPMSSSQHENKSILTEVQQRKMEILQQSLG